MAAVASALEQDLPPAEVLVCDDGSTDGTRERMEAWAREDPRVRYLRLSRNHGAPAAARNLGAQSAAGDWVAFLDSDDRWLPQKLRVQGEELQSGRYDVVASDAARTSGGPYFGLDAPAKPDAAEFLRHNPIITSTAVVRRSSLLASGGFPDQALGMPIRGVEDYAAWLNLASGGARFIVLDEPLVVYEDGGDDRISAGAARQEAEVAAVRWRLWLRRPTDSAVLRASLRATADAARHRLRAARAGYQSTTNSR